MVVDDDFDEGPLPDAGSSGCEEEGAAPQTAAAAPADEQPAAAGKSKAAAACVLCGQAAKVRWIECGCGARTHVECLGEHYLQVPCALPLCYSKGVILHLWRPPAGPWGKRQWLHTLASSLL